MKKSSVCSSLGLKLYQATKSSKPKVFGFPSALYYTVMPKKSLYIALSIMAVSLKGNKIVCVQTVGNFPVMHNLLYVEVVELLVS